MFRIEMLPARHGDCLWVEYGEPAAPHRILIDGGPGFAYPALRARVEALPPGHRHIDLLVVTHIDADHIEGVIRLLGDRALGVEFGDVWFNGWKQISGGMPPPFGAVQGEYLGAILGRLRLPWNRAFGGGPVVRSEGRIPSPLVLAGGAGLTLLGPVRTQLDRLRDGWEQALLKAGIEPDTPEEALTRLQKDRRLRPEVAFDPEFDPEALAARAFVGDDGVTNGSSIAFLLECEGRRAVFLGDAHAAAVEASLALLAPDRLKVDAVKLPHHGSRNNVSRTLVGRLDCSRYLVSTDGSYFGHPDAEAISRIVTAAGSEPQLFFNYLSRCNRVWSLPELARRYGLQTTYPDAGTAGLAVDL